MNNKFLNRHLLVIVSLLFYKFSFGQLKLDTLKYKIEPTETKLILINAAELIKDKVIKKRNFVLETSLNIQKFSINQIGDLIDTIIRIEKIEKKDSSIIFLEHQKIKRIKHYVNNELEMIANFKNGEQNLIYYKLLKPVMEYFFKQINGENKVKEIRYLPNGNRNYVKDGFTSRDTFYYDNGKIKSIKDDIKKSEKEYERNGNIEKSTYRVEIRNDFLKYETITDYYKNNKIFERKTIKFENQITTFRFKNNKIYEKEIATTKINGDRIIEIYDNKDKKISEKLEVNNRPTQSVPEQSEEN